jgi:hypothetical protein
VQHQVFGGGSSAFEIRVVTVRGHGVGAGVLANQFRPDVFAPFTTRHELHFLTPRKAL